MAVTYKILAQNKPSAATVTDLYTCPASTQFIGSSIVACNVSGASDKIRISVAVAGAANNVSQYIVYDIDVAAGDTYIATIGITGGATDVVRVYSLGGNISFTLFGNQIA